MSNILSSIGDVASSLLRGTIRQVDQSESQRDAIEQFLARLDTQGKGYLEAEDFQAALERLGLSFDDGSLTESGANDVVSALDMNRDGRVTMDDMTERLQTLSTRLDAWLAANEARSAGDQDEQEMTLVDHVAAADSNGDGNLTSAEAIAYVRSVTGLPEGDDAVSTSGTSTAAESLLTEGASAKQLALRRLSALMSTYGGEETSIDINKLFSIMA